MSEKPPLEFDTRTAIIRLGDDGIVRITLKPNVDVELEDLREHFRLPELLGDMRPRPVLVNSTDVRSVSREARNYLASDQPSRLVLAQAIVVASPLSRLIGSFFLGLNKLPCPTKLFTSESDAHAWLKTFLP